MKLEIYGFSKKELKELEGEWEERLGKYLGEYDGISFKSNKYTIDELKEFDYLHIFTKGGILVHSPKRFNQNIETSLEKDYIRAFGEQVQISLF